MPVSQVVAMAFLASALLATGRSQRSWAYVFIGVGGLASTTIVLVRDGLGLVLLSGPSSGSFTLSAGLIGLLLWADLVGLPPRLADATGIGIKGKPRDLWLRRRHSVSWFGVLGVSLLVVGAGQASGYDVDALRQFDPGAWLAIIELVFGAGFGAGAAVLAIRR